ncbi:hypothetical protein Tsubulata_026473 [Turnera subulata]|uniref:GDSL esterase/lipase n=1 Tax=Turnera subulata TaxID=218843 RepID=A0A9Q0FTN6_9ROSI|nr:hypothetical protein Tsubulata_026473 [Turnera subulata]
MGTKLHYCQTAFFLVLQLQALPCYSFTSFVFGDSLVDAGNNNYLFTLSRANSPPYGIDFKPSGGQPTGRFTNGLTISDIAGRIPLKEQVNNFKQTRNYMVNVMGEAGTSKFLKKAIFSITIGSNDILNYALPSIPFLRSNKVSPSMYQDFMVSNLTIQLKLGARKFIVVGVGPLGCIPFVRALKLLPSGKCSVEINELVQGYNKKLTDMLGGLNQEMGPESVFVYANSYDNVEEPCCGGYFPPFVCFNGFNENVTSIMCDDPSKYLFWDAYHPTEAANMVIAKELVEGDGGRKIIFPMSIRELYNYTA